MFCSKNLINYFSSVNGNAKKPGNELYLMYLIAKGYENHKSYLYKILTGEDYSDPYMYLEAQPITKRCNEGNTNLDLAMGSLKRRGTTESGIDYTSSKNEKSFLFCEAKWSSDISTKVSHFSSRNQLQRVIDNALYFTDKLKENGGKIFVVLLTPKQYKDEFENNQGSRLYAYKFNEYKNNHNQILDELSYINTHLPLKNNLENTLKNNLSFLELRWITLEEVIENIPDEKIKSQALNYYKK